MLAVWEKSLGWPAQEWCREGVDMSLPYPLPVHARVEKTDPQRLESLPKGSPAGKCGGHDPYPLVI